MHSVNAHLLSDDPAKLMPDPSHKQIFIIHSHHCQSGYSLLIYLQWLQVTGPKGHLSEAGPY